VLVAVKIQHVVVVVHFGGILVFSDCYFNIFYFC